MAPLFSIITVTYNAQDTIRRTLESVDCQTCKLYEHIIMDGASDDKTLEIISNYPNNNRIVFSEPDDGLYYAMNKGLAKAQGEYVIFLNSGDTFHRPETLQKIADTILNNDYPGIVYGQTDIVDKDGKYLGPRHLLAPKKLTLKSFKDGMVVCHQAFVVMRRISEYFNLKYKYSSDYEWCIICLQHSRNNIYINDTLIDYLAEGQTTKHHKESLKERFKIMRTYYGTIPAILMHFKFLCRYLARRRNAVNKQ